MEKVKSLSYAGEFLVWITTLVISLSGPCFCLYWILYQDESFFGEQIFNVTSALGPTAISLMGSIIIAEIFAGVFRGCMNSTIICYAADVEMFNELPGLASNDMLKSIIKGHEGHSANNSTDLMKSKAVVDSHS
jgi:hypothetical protein